MCELLGMVSNVPADLAFSFTGFALRGGQTGPHADGWGVSLYDGRFARTFLEPHPAFSSPLARFVRVFDRRHLVFAHNGTLPNVRDVRLDYESAIGETDSEHAFCVMLEALRKRHGGQYPKDPLVLGEFLYEIGNELGADGVFNFLLAEIGRAHV